MRRTGKRSLRLSADRSYDRLMEKIGGDSPGETSTPSAELFMTNEVTSLSHLIVFDPDMSETMLAVGYDDAAQRLAMSYKGEPWDDVILLPLLFLWRQAIELSMKATIRDLCQLRRANGHSDEKLSPAIVDKRLRSYRVGHRLGVLLQELEEHLAAVGGPSMPLEVSETIKQLAKLDESGTGFRYANSLNVKEARVNIATLAETLRHAWLLVHVTIDAVTNGEGVPGGG